MSEWLDLMLEEVERKSNEAADAQAETARRQSDNRDTGSDPTDGTSVQVP